jgi:hypothetical protein
VHNHPDILNKTVARQIRKKTVFPMFLLFLLIDMNALGQSSVTPTRIPDNLVVKIALNPDGTPGPVESATPLNSSKTISSDFDARDLVDEATRLEQDELERCQEKIDAALDDLRRVARHTTLEDVKTVTLATAQKCNIPCAMKQEFGFTRYDSLGRQHNPFDRSLAGREACRDTTQRNSANGRGGSSWESKREYDGFTIMGRGQHVNINLPVYGIFTNQYNPYGNNYFPFVNVPWRWYEPDYLYLIYQRAR